MSKITPAMVKELREMTGSAMMDCKRALDETAGNPEAAKEILRKQGQLIASKKSSRETKEGIVRFHAEDDVNAMIRVACETDFVARNEKFVTFADELNAIALRGGSENFTEQKTDRGTVNEMIIKAVAELGENISYCESATWRNSSDSVVSHYVHTNGKIGVMVELKAPGASDQTALRELGKDIAMHIAATKFEAITAEDCPPEVIEKEKAFLISQAEESGKPREIIEKMVSGRIKKFLKEICLLSQPFVKDPNVTVEALIKEKAKGLGGNTITVSRVFKTAF